MDLIHLFNKNQIGGRTPLEDFNTEAFANILKMYPEICDDFCKNFLQLPEDRYSIKTQYHQAINTVDPNCIIDLVFIGEKNVCYMENKVESTEGHKQLLRYVLALNEHHPEKQKYLIYCTKHSDPKVIDEKGFFFNQFRWYQIAKFLKSFKENPLIKSYLEFLSTYKMSQDNTLKSENLIAMENMRKTIEIAEFHIENSKYHFIKKFGYTSLNKNFNWDQIKLNNRVCYYVEKALNSVTGKWSEILYSIDFDNLKMIVQIYVDKQHECYKSFNNLISSKNLNKVEFEFGSAIQLQEDLGKFLNNEHADILIQEWFIESFNQLQKFIEENNELDWNLNT
ncbi:PD-(D/E)XK nuclease family protein [Arenibacter hampyeongensis]|uniref:PD-(D/E)XK nuclease family protein n=1 Tax=Arenibacter hampyeongensis TaxID=1028743 RepID=UPI0018645FEA|nr:PD-(D/E)XK nuclease family protein [Arenibacter hampyeongensis]